MKLKKYKVLVEFILLNTDETEAKQDLQNEMCFHSYFWDKIIKIDFKDVKEIKTK